MPLPLSFSRSIVGFLWEVTDVECDRVTVELIERLAPDVVPMPQMASFDTSKPRTQEQNIAACVRLSRKAATQFMTHAGVVNYGIPVRTMDQNQPKY
jgi:hypothetical protein